MNRDCALEYKEVSARDACTESAMPESRTSYINYYAIVYALVWWDNLWRRDDAETDLLCFFVVGLEYQFSVYIRRLSLVFHTSTSVWP